MSLADVCLAGIALGMTAYVVLGGADFGGGFWDLTAGGAERGRPLRELVRHSMGPVWETNHVWLVFVLVLAWTAFPVAFGSAMSTLYVTAFLAVGGIVLRGAAFALRGEASSRPRRGCSAQRSRSRRCWRRSASARRPVGSRPDGCRSAMPPAIRGHPG